MTDAVLMIALSKDGNHTQSAWTEHPLGAEGNFCQRVLRRRCGLARQFGAEVRITDPVRRCIYAAWVEVEPE